MFDNEARLLLCNQCYIEMYGLPAAVATSRCTIKELIELHFSTGIFSSIGDIDQYINDVLSGISAGRTVSKIVELSDHRVVAITNSPIPGGGRVSTHEDITEQRNAETQLRMQKLQLDTALNKMTQGLNMFDADGRLVVCNERDREMYRMPPEAVHPGCTVRDLVDARIAAGTFFAMAPEKYTTELRAAMDKRAPSSTTMELTDWPDHRRLQPAHARRQRLGGHARRHHRAPPRRKERDRSQAFVSTVIENVPATIVVKDARTLRYVLVNRASMIDKTSEEVLTPGIAEMIAQHDQDLLRTGETQFYDEHPVTTPGTGNRIITTTRMPIRDQSGDTQYLLTVIEDRPTASARKRNSPIWRTTTR